MPFRSKVRRAPKRGRASRARTCERRAGEGWERSVGVGWGGGGRVAEEAEGGGVEEYLAVIPPCDEEIIVPFAVVVVVGVVAMPRLERGT